MQESNYLAHSLVQCVGDFIQIRRDIHARPELAFEEHQTASLVADKLKGWGYEVTTGLGGTGVVGTLRQGQKGKSIGLRADMRIAAEAGIAVERGILVDAQLQTSVPRVFALGDCAQYASAGQRTLPYVMPIMNAAKVLGATLAGLPTALTFPLMPVSIKTPALPIVVAAAHPATVGKWVPEDVQNPGVWRFVDEQGVQRGFVLTGKQTARRMELSKTTSV